MQVGAAATAFTPLGIVLPETWAGLCIALSTILYARARFLEGALLALAAVFVRELAAPYAVVCACVALRRRRRMELAVLGAGGAVAILFYVGHALMAAGAIQTGDMAHPSWLQFGGFRFVLATI